MTPLESRRRAGMSVLEVIVMILVAMTFLAVLVPAIDASREASRRTTCTGRQRAIAEAILSYHEAHGRFPTGVAYPGGCLPDTGRMLWTFVMLPRLGHAEVADAIGPRILAPRPDDPAGWRPFQTVIPGFRCPSDSHLPFAYPLYGIEGCTVGNYVGCFSPHGFPVEPEADVACLTAQTINGGQRTTANPTVRSIEPWRTLPGRAVFNYQGVERRLDDVTDGAATTVMVSEVISGGPRADFRGTWWTDHGVQYSHWNTPNNPGPDYAELSDGLPQSSDRKKGLPPIVGWPGGWPAYLTSARSRHPGAVVAAFADGSVRTVTDGIERDVWRALGSMNGGDDAADQ